MVVKCTIIWKIERFTPFRVSTLGGVLKFSRHVDMCSDVQFAS